MLIILENQLWLLVYLWYYWPKMSVKMAFFQAIGQPLVTFTDSKKGSSDDKFHDCVINESQLLHSLFASLLGFALSSKIQSKTCYREEYDRCKVQHMVKICLNLASFEGFATAVLQTVGKGGLSSHDGIFWIRSWKKWCMKLPEKNHVWDQSIDLFLDKFTTFTKYGSECNLRMKNFFRCFCWIMETWVEVWKEKFCGNMCSSLLFSVFMSPPKLPWVFLFNNILSSRFLSCIEIESN